MVGEPFLSFQWDVLLTETLFLSFFSSTMRLTSFLQVSKISRISRLLLVALLAKLMIESGVVKFTYFAPDGTNTWKDLTALNFHYWSQPLPHPLSPLIDSLPSWFDRISLFIMYAIELILPLLFFLPKMETIRPAWTSFTSVDDSSKRKLWFFQLPHPLSLYSFDR